MTEAAQMTSYKRAVTMLDMDVFTAAKERVRWLYHEFDGKICATSSGGKDSLVVIELAALVAKEEGYPPPKIWFLDQEVEFDATVEFQRYLAYERDDIDFMWYQIPFRMENSTDMQDPWFNPWGEGEEWLREKEPNSIKENYFGEDNFYKILDAIRVTDFKGYATLGGMRIEESPNRRGALTSQPQYKWVTWSSKKDNPRFEPIYDWTYRDVWAAIEQNGWRYNKHYDHMYQYGIPPRQMRVSSFTHNQSLKSLNFMQEVEPDLWERATKRLPSLQVFGQLQEDQYIRELPYMFTSWLEYMSYLIENLVPEEDQHIFYQQYVDMMKYFPDEEDLVGRVISKSVISGDHHGIRVGSRIANRDKENRMERYDNRTQVQQS